MLIQPQRPSSNGYWWKTGPFNIPSEIEEVPVTLAHLKEILTQVTAEGSVISFLGATCKKKGFRGKASGIPEGNWVTITAIRSKYV